MKNNKKDLGQFNTTKADYILQGFEPFVKDKEVYDPFAGGGDLLKWAFKNGAKSVSGSDIDSKLVKENIEQNDSLKNIKTVSMIGTNPPYLAKNKMTVQQKKQYPMDDCEDFYLLAVKKILESNTDEFFIIIPINFFSAENSDRVRKELMTKYEIKKVNYFTEQVFDDTTYNVVAFYCVKKTVPSTAQKITINSFPDKTEKIFDLEEEFNYRIAGRELYKITSIKSVKTTRLTEKHMSDFVGNVKIETSYNDLKTPFTYWVKPSFKKIIDQNILVLNCIDTNGSEDGWIHLDDIRSYSENISCLVGKNTSRNLAYVIVNCSLEQQEKIIPLFNNTLNDLRKKYDSLFLTNFRDNNRKRISFDFCYKLITYCLYQIDSIHF